MIINLDDVREVRDSATQEPEDRTVQVDPFDLIGAANYDEAIDHDIQGPLSLAFDEIDEETEPIEGAGESALHEAVPGDVADPDAKAPDTSKLILMHQKFHLEMSKLEKALAAYADLYGISRDQWASLREVLNTIRDGSGNVPKDIAELPRQLSTLIDRFRSRLPLMNMREAVIPLKAEKMPTEARTRRAKLIESLRKRLREKEERTKGKSAKAKGKEKATSLTDVGVPQSDKGPSMASCKLTYFDPPTVVKNLVSSDIGTKDMHHGPGIFVDKPTELFHSRAWTSSVRASGGVYPHLQATGILIIPGDFIYYRCTEAECFCHGIDDDSDDTIELHIGRINSFGYDMRTGSCTGESKEVLALQVQPCFTSFNVNELSVALDPPIDDQELILGPDLIFIPESNAFSGLDVFKDYQYGECMDNPSLPKPKLRKPTKRAPKEQVTFAKYEDPDFVERNEDQWYSVRRVVVVKQKARVGNAQMIEDQVVSLCHTHPIRAEIEVDYYGRYKFEYEWDQALENATPVISVPVETFIDGFGIFSNSYRSLLGYYITPCGLSAKDRLRPGNIIPLVLGPHGSDFGDVVKGLGTLVDLDRGIKMDINGRETLVTCWTMVFIGDMPQQAENCGFKGSRAHKFCRGCYIGVGHKSFTDPISNVEFDTTTHGRFHYQVKQMQRTMAHLEGAKRELYGSQWGMSNPHPALLTIAPALDIILSRPYDPCHSEYSGLFNLAHFLFRDAILSPGAVDEYTLELRAFQFPPNSRRLQSPKHHLSSYDMSSHALWGTMIPVFLRGWLTPAHLKPRFLQEATAHGDPVDIVVGAFTAMARSTAVLMGYSAPKEDYANMELLIRQGREAFNQLCYIASVSAASRAGSRAGSMAAASRAGSRAGSIAPQNDPDIEELQTGLSKDMGLLHMADTQRPNMHIAVHYHDFAAEYAMMVNCNTLTGEDLHR